MIDFSAALTAHADEPIFYRTDHHWTSLGPSMGPMLCWKSWEENH